MIVVFKSITGSLPRPLPPVIVIFSPPNNSTVLKVKGLLLVTIRKSVAFNLLRLVIDVGSLKLSTPPVGVTGLPVMVIELSLL